jgi:hypothetical protein
MGSLVLEAEKGSIVLEISKTYGLKDILTVILPMVLQMRGSMVLQRIELEGKANSPPFWFFVSIAALMGKHGFAEKLHF